VLSCKAKLRTFASFMYQASSWKRPRWWRRPVSPAIGCSEHSSLGGQMENLIKLHKAQLASDRMSCHSATANQVRLVLHTAAFWLMHGVRAAIPRTSRSPALSSRRSESA
jgi:hypothetical protein